MRNILAITYVGASLTLLLLFYTSNHFFLLSLNNEIFASEIIRMIIWSMGIIFAVPIATIGARIPNKILFYSSRCSLI